MPKLAVVPEAAGTAPPPRSEAREKLAQAITAYKAAEAALTRLEAASTDVSAASIRAMQRQDQAEADLECAKQGSAAFLIAQATGEQAEAPTSITDARRELDEARDAYDVARATREGLPPAVEKARHALDFARSRLTKAAVIVLREAPAVLETLADVERLQRELVERGLALEWLMGASVFPETRAAEDFFPGAVEPERARTAYRRLQSPPQFWNGLRHDGTAQQRWQAAFDALMQDADAPIPGES